MHGNEAFICQAGSRPVKPQMPLTSCQSARLCSQQSFHLCAGTLLLCIYLWRREADISLRLWHTVIYYLCCPRTNLWINIDNINIQQNMASSISWPYCNDLISLVIKHPPCFCVIQLGLRNQAESAECVRANTHMLGCLWVKGVLIKKSHCVNHWCLFSCIIFFLSFFIYIYIYIYIYIQ